MKKIITLFIVSILSFGLSFAAVKYPLNTCIVTNNKLGSMGKVITKVYNNQEVKFCCKPCVSKFEKNPEKYLNKIKK